MRGLVYKDKYGVLTLLKATPNGFASSEISDEESIYTDMPATKCEVVDIELVGTSGEDERLALKSLCGMTFYDDGGRECPSHEAINHGVEHAPVELLHAIITAKVDERRR